jgi:hypothetical protein
MYSKVQLGIQNLCNAIFYNTKYTIHSSIQQWCAQEFFWGGVTPEIFFGGNSTNSVEDRGQREWGSGGGSPLVRGYTQFANE